MDLIERQAAIDGLKEAFNPSITNFVKAKMVIDDLPSAQPQRIRGKWTVKEGELAFWDVCSVCRKVIIHITPHYNFCPNCGADMRGEQDG